jgi:flavin reductase (DIM6/NTAB) family NADH-FMN oxidoreductase RutF
MAIPGVTEAQADRTEQAVGRIIGSLCVLTTRHCGLDYGLLTAWVSQASFNPPGLMISIPKKPTLELYLDCGHAFVLNILKEGRNLRRHFSAQLENQTCAGLATQTAGNHCLILKDALAYLECTVQQRIETGDCWLIYALVQQGDLLSPDGITAIQQRKSGRQY